MKLNTSVKEMDPLRKTTFEVCFISDQLKPEENMLLQEMVLRMSQHDITFNVNVIKNKIEPINILSRFIADKTIDLTIELNLHNTQGDVIGKFEYKGVRLIGSDFFDLDVDYQPGVNAMGVKFAQESDEFQKEAIVYFEYDRRFFDGVEITNL